MISKKSAAFKEAPPMRPLSTLGRENNSPALTGEQLLPYSYDSCKRESIIFS
jgi:hypothetical protein